MTDNLPKENNVRPADTFAGGSRDRMIRRRSSVRASLLLTAAGFLAVAVPLLLMKLGLMDPYTARIITMGGVNAIMAMSVNMIVGITGQLSLGQAGFLAIGAYACIFFNIDIGLPLPLAAIAAVLLTTLAGFLIGFPVLKLSGDYLAIVTLGFGEIIRVIFINLKAITGGPNGRQFTTIMKMNGELAFGVVTAVLIILLALLQNFLRSTYGRAIMACRDDEIAANSSGIDIFRYKMLGFVIAAFIAGAGGCLYAMVVGLVQPNAAQFLRSIDFLIYVVLGGMGSMTGSILSAYVLTYLQEILRFLQDYRLLIYPLILIFVMLFRPQGLLGMREFSFTKTWKKLLDAAAKKKNREESPSLSLDSLPAEQDFSYYPKDVQVIDGGEEELLLSISNLSIVFGGLRAVSDFSCDLYRGELMGLIGPNGAGKTTVFNMISGVYTPTDGKINFKDRRGKNHSIGTMSPAALNRIGIARTFQNIRLFSRMTVEDNVRIALHSRRTINPLDAIFRTGRFLDDEERMREKTAELLALFRIEDKKHELARNLSYGEQRKLEIARAMASNPSLLLLDEPAAGMNPQETAELMKLISFIRKEFHLTILLIEHDMHLVMGICERLSVLDYGRSIAEGLPEEIRKNPAVIKAYLGQDALDQNTKLPDTGEHGHE